MSDRLQELLNQLHPSKNPKELNRAYFIEYPGSNRKIWWICDKGHEWRATFAERNRGEKGSNCPYCNHKLPTPENNLAVCYPELAKEWDYTKNGKRPEECLPKSGKKVWWICSQQHSWLAKVQNRTSLGRGCPYCAGQRATYENSLIAKYPEVAKEYSPKNKIPIAEVLPFANFKAWWLCSVGHEWEAVVHDRTMKSGACPYCSKRIAFAEYNLEVLFPEIAAEWDYSKNAKLPHEFTPRSQSKVYWKCKEGHEWATYVHLRTKPNGKGTRCPFCIGKRPSSDYNLELFHPEIIKEWDYDKNSKPPSDYTPGSNHKVHWKCEKGHEWETAIVLRTRPEIGTNCPRCAIGVSGLEQKFIDLMKDVFPDLDKFDITLFSPRRFRPDFKLENNGKILYVNLDGLYYHNEDHKDNNYHMELRRLFESNNARLMQFYWDEITDKPEIVKSMVLNYLGMSKYQFYARKCEIRDVPGNVAKDFFNSNHLMGHYKAAKAVGLYYDSELLAVLSYRKLGPHIEIARFASRIYTIVVGGFSRLLRVVKDRFPGQSITSFCDLRYSTGASYEKVDFEKVSENVSWCWSDGNKRYNRLQCRAGNGKTERENAAARRWFRVYDAGQAKYFLK